MSGEIKHATMPVLFHFGDLCPFSRRSCETSARVFPIPQIPTKKLPKRICSPHLEDHLQLNQPVTCAWNLTACKKHYQNTTFFGFLYFPYLLSCRNSSESFVGTGWEFDSCWHPVSGPFWARVLGPYISNRCFLPGFFATHVRLV